MIDYLIQYGNLAEGVLWIVVGACFAAAMVRGGSRRMKLVAAINFVLFGCSDFVERRTGAWWRPWWLLLWKAACVAVMVLQLAVYLRLKRGGHEHGE